MFVSLLYQKFESLSIGKASCDRVAPSNLLCMLVALAFFHYTPNYNMDYKIFNVFNDINAYDGTWRCKNTVREFALKVDFARVD